MGGSGHYHSLTINSSKHFKVGTIRQLQTECSSAINTSGGKQRCQSQSLKTRAGHAYAEYAVHADYAHMREYADADENLIHIIHI